MPKNQEEMREKAAYKEGSWVSICFCETSTWKNYLESVMKGIVYKCQIWNGEAGRTSCSMAAWSCLCLGEWASSGKTSPTPVTRIKTYSRAWNLISSGFINLEFMQLDWVWFDVYLWFAQPFLKVMQIHGENKIARENVEDTADPSPALGICLEAFVNDNGTRNSLCTVQSSGNENFEKPSYP